MIDQIKKIMSFDKDGLLISFEELDNKNCQENLTIPILSLLIKLKTSIC